MKAKSLLFSLLFMSGIVFSTSSCDSFKSVKLYNLKSENLDSYVLLTQEELTYHITNGADMILMVSLDTCLGCHNEKAFIRQYASETNNIIYVTNYYAYSAIQPTYSDNLPEVSGTPTYLIIKNGDTKKTISKTHSSYEDFKNDVTKYLYDTNLYSLNTYVKQDHSNGTDIYYTQDNSDTTVLKNAITSKEDITVFFTWLRCGDCKNFHSSTFDKYLVDNPNKMIYQFEVNYFRANKPGTLPPPSDETYDDYMLWLNFANEFEFGSYRDGKVPVLVNYQDGVKTEMAVFANDTDITQDEDGMYYYGTSFWNQEVTSIKAKSVQALSNSVLAKESELMIEFLNDH